MEKSSRRGKKKNTILRRLCTLAAVVGLLCCSFSPMNTNAADVSPTDVETYAEASSETVSESQKDTVKETETDETKGKESETSQSASEKAAETTSADETESTEITYTDGTLKGIVDESKDIKGYKVTVTYDAKAEIPADATLKTTEIQEGTKDFEKYYGKAEEALSDKNIELVNARFFNIEIQDSEGNMIEPKDEVKVKITYDDPVETEAKDNDYQIIHFTQTDGKEDKKPEMITEVKTDEKDEQVSEFQFKTNSFSSYGVLQTAQTAIRRANRSSSTASSSTASVAETDTSSSAANVTETETETSTSVSINSEAVIVATVEGERISETQMTMTLTATATGNFYYIVQDATAAAPTVDEVISTGTQVSYNTIGSDLTLTVSGLSTDAQKIYAVFRDSTGLFTSDMATADVPTYTEKSYSAEIDATSYDFGSKETGYTTAPTAKEFTITNTGDYTIKLALSDTSYDGYTVTLASSRIAAGESTTLTVQPKTGLDVGTYEATITVKATSEEGAALFDISTNVAFLVTEATSNVYDYYFKGTKVGNIYSEVTNGTNTYTAYCINIDHPVVLGNDNDDARFRIIADASDSEVLSYSGCNLYTTTPYGSDSDTAATILANHLKYVLYYGYPNDMGGLKTTYDLTDTQFYYVTQAAVWYFTDFKYSDSATLAKYPSDYLKLYRLVGKYIGYPSTALVSAFSYLIHEAVTDVTTVDDWDEIDQIKLDIFENSTSAASGSHKGERHQNLIASELDTSTDITISKKWVDNGNAQGKRPSIEEFSSWLKLYRKIAGNTEENEVSATPTITPNGNTYTIEYSGLDATDADGNKYTYYVKEEMSSDWQDKYTVSYPDDGTYAENGETITNTLKEETPETISVTVTKIWDDGNDSSRPSTGNFASWLVLYQTVNGETTEVANYYPTVSDNGDSTYTISYTELPKYDSDGNAITYSVGESETYLKDAGYTLTVKDEDGNTLGSSTATDGQQLVNTKAAVTDVTLKKTDAKTNAGLEGVVFTLTKDGDTEFSKEITSGSEGVISITGLAPGTYYLTETTAQSGYVIPDNPWTIVIAEDLTVTVQDPDNNLITITGTEYVITNMQIYELPSTGGIGTTPFKAAGTALMLTAVLEYLSSRRKKEERGLQ